MQKTVRLSTLNRAALKWVALKWILLVTSLLVALPGYTADPAIIRTAITPDGTIWVGQQVVLQLDILGLDGWADSKRLPEFEVSGAYLIRVESQGTRLSETISGGSYSGQRHEWLLFPQRAGQIAIPATDIEVKLKVFGADIDEQIIPMKTPAVSFVAQGPPGAEQIAGLISTTEFTVTQTWQPDEANLRAGDGIKRTIRFKAANVSGMAFTPLNPETVPDLAVYPGEPEVADEINRGTLDFGRRIETMTYVPAQAGEYKIPDISYRWWDIKQEILHQETLEGLKLTVSKALQDDSTGSGVSGDGGQRLNWKYVTLSAVVLVFSVSLLVLLRQRRLYPRWRAYQALRGNSEAAWFRRFRKAAQNGGLDETMAALMNWLDRLQLPDRPARLGQFMQAFADESGRRQTEAFVSAFNQRSGSGWSSRNLIREMAIARSRYLQQAQARVGKISSERLRPLNP